MSLKEQCIGDNKHSWNQYLVAKNGMFISDVKATTAYKLPANIYHVFPGQNGETVFLPKSVDTDKLLNLPGMSTNLMLNDLLEFWNESSRFKYEEMGLVYKRGILLHGKPGTGKTASIVSLCSKIVKDDGIVIYNPEPQALSEAIKQIRSIEDVSRKVLVVFEEVDRIVDNSDFLSLLDGELQINSITYVATTNHINKIPHRIKNRKSRFAKVIEVGTPSLQDRVIYITNKLNGKVSVEFIQDIAKKTEGFVIDQLKDVIISYYVFNISIDVAIEEARIQEVFESEDEDTLTDSEVVAVSEAGGYV